jgi:subtilase family serine protease
MQAFRLSRFALSVLACSVSSLALAGTEASTRLEGSVAPWVASAKQVGSASDDTMVTLAFYIGFTNTKELDALVAAQTRPGSPEYGKYLTPAEFHERFGADKAKVALVQESLRKMGFAVTHTPKSGYFVEARGTVAQIKNAFHVSQDLYKFQGKVLRANAQAPSLPAALAGSVTYIKGLDETGLLMHPDLKGQDAAVKPASLKTQPKAGPGYPGSIPSPYCSTYFGDTVATLSTTPAPFAAQIPWLPCGYSAAQLRNAYGADVSGLDGTGVTVAIVDAYASPTIRYDANSYSKINKLPPLTSANFGELIPPGLTNVPADAACGPQGWYVEETLDVESVHAMAPGATILFVGAEDCNTSLFNADYLVIDEGYASIITNSWSENGEWSSPAEVAVVTAEYKQAAVEGISILFSSGDDGDLSQVNGVVSGAFPATSDWVTAVGGTSLALYDKTGNKDEWGWGNYRDSLDGVSYKSSKAVTTTGLDAAGFSFYAGAGGGPSFSQPQPPYQTRDVSPALSTYTYSMDGEPIPLGAPKRVTPDVAMVADPYTGIAMVETFAISGVDYLDSSCKALDKTTELCSFTEGGTSLASPLFAGVLALINQARGTAGLGTLGFANPALYALKVGLPGTTKKPIADIEPPKAPTAVLRGYLASYSPTAMRLVTMNSAVTNPCAPNNAVCYQVYDGFDDAFLTTAVGYDDVTGVGTPYVPQMAAALTAK